MGKTYAVYHARDWAEGKSIPEIQAEIAYCDQPRDYQWNEVGNADMAYWRVKTLQAIILERGGPST